MTPDNIHLKAAGEPPRGPIRRVVTLLTGFATSLSATARLIVPSLLKRLEASGVLHRLIDRHFVFTGAVHRAAGVADKVHDIHFHIARDKLGNPDLFEILRTFTIEFLMVCTT